MKAQFIFSAAVFPLVIFFKRTAFLFTPEVSSSAFDNMTNNQYNRERGVKATIINNINNRSQP